MTHLIDTHCHLNADEFALDLATVITNAEHNGVNKFYLPSVDSAAIPSMLQLEQDYPGKCFAMMGLHPCYVKETYLQELETVSTWLAKRNFAAVGEIGLDFYWDTTFKKEQYQCFEKQIELAIQYDLPIVIHSRNSMDETIEVVKCYQSEKLRGIFHCFSGTIQQANEIIAAGFYLGIGGVVTYKKAGLAEVVKDIPLENLVLETDAPYLTPIPYRGKRNEPGHVLLVAQKIAEIKNVEVEKVVAHTTQNASQIFPLQSYLVGSRQ